MKTTTLTTVHKFYKKDSKWFISLPGSNKTEDDLIILEGGAMMLEQMSNGESEIYIKYSNSGFSDSNLLTLMRESPEYGEGVFYILKEYNKEPKNLTVWFCDTVKLIFNYFPQCVYFKQVSKEEFLQQETAISEFA